MLGALAVLLLCQLAGEVVARGLALPVPGPVLGMIVLFAGLALRRSAPEPLRQTAEGLLAHLSLLFVPAGVGVILHLERIRAEWLAILAALIGSTLLTLVVTAWVFRLVARVTGEKREETP